MPWEYIWIGVAEGAAEQRMSHGQSGDLAGDVPEGHVDAAHGGDVGHVGMHERGEVEEMLFDGEGVLADQAGAEPALQAGAHHGAGESGLAVAGDAAVGVDFDEAVAGGELRLHRLDGSDLYLSLVGCGEGAQAGKRHACGQRCGELQHLTSSHG